MLKCCWQYSDTTSSSTSSCTAIDPSPPLTRVSFLCSFEAQWGIKVTKSAKEFSRKATKFVVVSNKEHKDASPGVQSARRSMCIVMPRFTKTSAAYKKEHGPSQALSSLQERALWYFLFSSLFAFLQFQSVVERWVGLGLFGQSTPS